MQAYLTFNGNAAEALAFYAKALDGKITFSMTFGESPMGGDTPAAYKDKIMHATLEARGHQLMASNAPPEWPFEGYKGFSLSVQGNNVDEGKKHLRCTGRRRQGHDALWPAVLGRGLRHADRQVRRAVDGELREVRPRRQATVAGSTFAPQTIRHTFSPSRGT